MNNQKSKKIGIDARFYGEAGPGRYVKNIVQHLEKLDTTNDYIIFMRSRGYDLYKPQNPKFKKVLANYPWYSFKEQFVFLFQLLKFNLDLLYIPHFNIPVLYPGKIVTAIPDIIMHKFSTERGTTLPKSYFRFKKFVYFLVVWWAVIRSEKVIVPSIDVKNDFVETYKSINPNKFVVAYEGIDPDILNAAPSEGVLEKFGITKPFLLYISSMYEHKNVARLLEAFKILVDRYNFTGQLVLVGKKDKFSAAIVEKVRELRLQYKVVMPGEQTYLSDADTVALRKSAELYVFPSLKEGFSLTPLEAMALGLPAVISDIPCHKEIYGNSVEYFDPQNSKDIAQKLNRVLNDAQLRQELVNRGYAQIKKYNWADTARITLANF